MKLSLVGLSLVGLSLVFLSLVGLAACTPPVDTDTQAETSGNGAPSLVLPEDATRPPVCADCNVVLVLADTLRADRLGAYGHDRDTSPFFDRFAARGTLFEQARAQASCTTPSVNSLLTSRSPRVFEDPSTWPTIPDGVPSLAELLKAAGYATAAVSASPIVRATPSDHNLKGGFGRGFDHFDESCEWYPAPCVTTRAREQIDQLEEPFFLYAHYMDPHDPYVAQAPYLGTWSEAVEAPSDPGILAGSPNRYVEPLRRARRVEVDPIDARFLKARYDEEIRTLDDGLARLVRILEERELDQRTLVIIASDHGETFGEHQSIKHCYTVWDSEVHVPLVAVGPGIHAGRRAHGVANLDIVPTVLDLLGLEIPESVEGLSLAPLLGPDPVASLGPRDDRRAVPSGQGRWRAVADGQSKLMIDLKGEHDPALFDLQADPDELENRALERRREVARLRRWLREAETASPTDTAEQLRRAREVEEQLRSLGYLG